ncbi:MAG TPA: hypothetical protein VN025_19290 [Candidatus Dormibacteraeota bacterium]|jgi:hypothetical protein|nr:hypothetical protein [Candidatus Dormibacteraeota bacterium]
MLTLFSTPKPFLGHINVIQRNALQSWKLLHPDVEVVLFGDDEGAAEVCREFGFRHEPEVLRSKLGTKRLDSIFGKAQQIAKHETVCYANCDIILTQDFLEAHKRLAAWRPNHLMVGRRWDTDITDLIDFSNSDWRRRIIEIAKREGIQRFYHNIDYFLFPRGLYKEIPPLVIGRIWWDHWLVGKARALGAGVVDVSEVVCAIHQNHDYGYHAKGIEGVWSDEDARRNHELAKADCRLGTIEDAPYRLTKKGIEKNGTYWAAPAKRKVRAVVKKVRAAMRSNLWHPLLNLTRPLRHSVGLKKDALPNTHQSSERKHWMDQ